ncbi:MAG: hypothetical protein HQ582_29840 [Planctomycetes bacterium]|nr:hypothetical protein [Planctomycetota bacterium]
MNDLGSPPVDEGRCPAAVRIVVSVLLGISCLAVQPRTTWAQTLRQPNQSTNSVGSKFLEFAGMVFPREESRTRDVDPKSGQSQQRVQLALARMAVRLEEVALSTKDGVESRVADLLQTEAEPGAEVAVEAGEAAEPLQDSIASDCIREHSEALGAPGAVEAADRVRLARHQTSTLLAGPVPAPPVPGEPAAGDKLEMDLLEDKSPFYVESDHSACTTEVEHRPIGSLGTNIVCSEGVLPPDCARAKFEPAGEAWDDGTPLRNWMQVAYPWEASYLCHRPLYFEEINLERYGYMNCDHRCGGIPAAVVQPVLSGAHFFATVPILPYKMVVEPPCKCIYALGHYRPGSPVPYRINRIPLRPTAGVVETAVIAGTVLAFP